MLDVGMIMFVGLAFLFVWRLVFNYRCCGYWLSFLSYSSLLYTMLAICTVYSLNVFLRTSRLPVDPLALRGDGDPWEIVWMRPFVHCSVWVVAFTVVLSWVQSEAHIFEIRKHDRDKSLRDKHDRAVQIIALPAVFAVMVMSSMVPILELVTGTVDIQSMETPFGIDVKQLWDTEVAQIISKLALVEEGVNHGDHQRQFPFVGRPSNMSALERPYRHSTTTTVPRLTTHQDWEELLKVSMWRYETCFYVADLFEAWALYQFGCLALELIAESYNNSKRSRSRELEASLAAVTSLTWLGTITFVLVCVAQTTCSLWPYLGGSEEKQQLIMMSFQVAGFFASGAAIYNVFVVERAFHEQLAGCSPMLKFLSVKLLVSLSFFQRGILVVLQTMSQLLPGTVQGFTRYVPFVGDLLNLTTVQMHLFYPALILFECLLASIMHLWAWRPSEDWYSSGVVMEPQEREAPLSPTYRARRRHTSESKDSTGRV